MGCRRRADPAGLVRITLGPDAELRVGAPGGRGAWLCAGSQDCLDAAVRRRALGRALRAPVDDEAAQRLRRSGLDVRG